MGKRKMLWKALSVVVGVILLTWGGSSKAERNVVASRRMNNFVTELLNVKIAASPHSKHEFSNPRDGWVFFSTTVDKSSSTEIRVSIDSAPKEKAIILHKEGRTAEAMRWLAAGKHRIEIWIEGKSSAILIVRMMPEIIFSNFVGEERSDTGAPYKLTNRRIYLYYWDFLQKHILKNVNVVTGSGDTPWMKRWISEGKKVIYVYPILEKDLEQLYAFWSQFFKEPYEGVLVDEFIPRVGKETDPWYNPGFNYDSATMGVINRLHDTPELRGTFYAYMGLPWKARAEDCRLLLETLIPRGYKWVPEMYLWEQPTEAAAREDLDVSLKRKMLDFRDTFPGSEKSCVVCLSILEAWDRMPHVDFKVWLDMQMNMVANDPAFDGLYGVMAYQSTSADPELIRWLGHLYRHYCIAGRTELLSKQYGYRLMLNHIENPGFAAGKTGWSFSPAEERSITVNPVSDLPFKKVYLPKGGNVLVMKRSAKTPNIISQEIKNLQPGRLYSLRMYSCDIRDLVTQQKYATSINLKRVEVIEGQSLQDMQQGDGSNAPRACWNYHYRVFRATADRATIEISDWADDKTPGGLIGQEILYDFVQIQPFFEAARHQDLREMEHSYRDTGDVVLTIDGLQGREGTRDALRGS